MRVGVDVGGTFTDFVGLSDDGKIVLTKSSTTPRQLTNGILHCFTKAGLTQLSAVSQVFHGSTVSINTIIQRVGAKTALITTRGMRDVYEIGRGNRPDTWNVFFHRPRPLVTREWRLEISERMSAKGEVLVPLDEAELADIVRLLRRENVAAVAVCFLHSYRNPIHEQRVAEVLRRELPQVYVSPSHELIREMREYERTSTTVLNAYVGPVVSRYLDELDERLAAMKLAGPLLIMQSNGGCMSVDVAKRNPVLTTESGPVSGVIGAGHLADALGLPSVIAFDMGGTTAKTAFIQNGIIPIGPGCYIGGYETGQPMMVPVVDIIEIGAGGGSIAAVDEVGGLAVGPKSAGAEPGPVCYGNGGTEPTVTDANVALGRLNPANFLGGEMRLDQDLAIEAIRKHVAGPKEMNVEQAADAILQIVTANMSLAVRQVSVERGVDPRDCVIVAFGGAGPLHAVAVAKELQIPKVVVPRMPGHFCALGMLLADLRHDYVQSYLADLKSADMNDVLRHLRDFAEQARATLLSEGAGADTIRFVLELSLRYRGQNHVLPVETSFEELESFDYKAFTDRYHATHFDHYGHSNPEEATELVSMKLVASAGSGKLRAGVFQTLDGGHRTAEASVRRVYLGPEAGWTDTSVYQRERLGAGFRTEGPAIVEERASTTMVFPGDRLAVDRLGNLVIDVSPGTGMALYENGTVEEEAA